MSSKKLLTAESISDALTTVYDSGVISPPVISSVQELADEYMKKTHDISKAADSLIRWQCAKVGAAGFLLGLPGGVAAAATIPADIAQTMYVQLRMSAAIAYMYGLDPHSDQCRVICYLAMCGSACSEVLKKTGTEAAKMITKKAIKDISTETLKAINKKVGGYLVSRWSTKSVVTLGKIVPVVGGIVGASMDIATVKATGAAIKMLCEKCTAGDE